MSLEKCGVCDGTGEIEVTRDCTPTEDTGGMSQLTGTVVCPHCHGMGTQDWDRDAPVLEP
jgi:DnaJ-class molecular chaperone